MNSSPGGYHLDMAEEVLLRLDVLCDERAPGRVRSSLASCREIGKGLQDLLLIASELVTNAILHSGCDRQDLLAVRLARRDRHLVLSVRDPGHSGQAAAVARPRPPGGGGLGLKIVELLAERWGQNRAGDYRVWAEVPLAGKR